MSTDPHEWHSAAYVEDWVRRSREDDERRAQRFQLMARLIAFPRDASLRLLDIGAGHGPLTRAMLDAFPGASIVAQDFSSQMLEHARESLAPYGSRVRYHISDLFTQGWMEGLDGPFHAAVTSLCLHNLQDPRRIQELYREIHGLLVEGGCFLSLDLVSAPSPSLQAVYWDVMMRQRQGKRTPGAIEQEERRMWNRSVDDEWPPFPASTEDQLRWLREAGFRDVDCFWKEMGMALTGGFRSPEEAPA